MTRKLKTAHAPVRMVANEWNVRFPTKGIISGPVVFSMGHSFDELLSSLLLRVKSDTAFMLR